MYVISANTANADESTRRIFPADRCSWDQSYQNDQREYLIEDAQFYPGNGTTVSGVALHEATLGYIGKSGRFVAITNTH